MSPPTCPLSEGWQFVLGLDGTYASGAPTWPPTRQQAKHACQLARGEPRLLPAAVAALIACTWAQLGKAVGPHLPAHLRPCDPEARTWPSCARPQDRRHEVDADNRQGRPAPAPVVICLDRALPAVWVDLSVQQAMMNSLELWGPGDLLKLDMPVSGVPPCTLFALEAVEHFNWVRCSEVESWLIYVDGGSSTSGAAWGVVLLARISTLLYYAGAAWGHLPGTCPPPTNNAAELVGACWAALLAGCLPGEARAVVHHDSLQVRGAIDGTYNFESNKEFAATARTLASWARARRAVDSYHIKSHSDHPWNELADALAGERVTDLPPFDHDPPLLRATAQDRDLLEHFIAILSDGGFSLPPLQGEGFWARPSDPPHSRPISPSPRTGRSGPKVAAPSP